MVLCSSRLPLHLKLWMSVRAIPLKSQTSEHTMLLAWQKRRKTWKRSSLPIPSYLCQQTAFHKNMNKFYTCYSQTGGTLVSYHLQSSKGLNAIMQSRMIECKKSLAKIQPNYVTRRQEGGSNYCTFHLSLFYTNLIHLKTHQSVRYPCMIVYGYNPTCLRNTEANFLASIRTWLWANICRK